MQIKRVNYVIYQLTTEIYKRILEFLKSSLLQLQSFFDLNDVFTISDPVLPENNQLPEQKPERKYRVTFNGLKEERECFKESTCQLTISVGQMRHHDGEHFRGTLELISRSFKRCVIMVDDSIQAKTIAIKNPTKTLEECRREAIEAGDFWLMRNLPAIGDLLGNMCSVKIILWRDWDSNPNMQTAFTSMCIDYEKTPELRDAIDETANVFLSRCQEHDPKGDYKSDRARRLCVDYLLEECSGMRSFWTQERPQIEVYPSTRTEAMKVTHELYIEKTSSESILKAVSLRFKAKETKLDELRESETSKMLLKH
jgi:hypothetical protein